MMTGLRAGLLMSGLIHGAALLVPLAGQHGGASPPLTVRLVLASSAPVAPDLQAQAAPTSPPASIAPPTRPEPPAARAAVQATPQVLTQHHHRDRPVVRKRPQSKAPIEARAPAADVDHPPSATPSRTEPPKPAMQAVAAARIPSGRQAASTGADTAVPPTLVPPMFGLAYLNNPKPVYPLAARRRGIEGRVLLRVRVSAAGQPMSTDIEDSSGHRILDLAARDAVREWRFVPAHRGDEPVEAFALVPIRFSLSG